MTVRPQQTVSYVSIMRYKGTIKSAIWWSFIDLQVKITKIKFSLKFISKLFIILVVLLLLGYYIFQFFDSIYVHFLYKT